MDKVKSNILAENTVCWQTLLNLGLEFLDYVRSYKLLKLVSTPWHRQFHKTHEIKESMSHKSGNLH